MTALKAIIKVNTDNLRPVEMIRIRDAWKKFIETNDVDAIVIDNTIGITIINAEMVDGEPVFILPDGARISADAPVIELP